MGFPTDLAEAALTATGGTSALKATDWILSCTSSSPTTTPPSATSQPKLDRFFLSQSPNSQSQHQKGLPKRNKLLVPETPQQPPANSADKPAPSSSNHHQPLSKRIRPRTLNDVVGQDHLLAPHSLLRFAIKCDRLPSLVFWGPPGTGKTSIAKALLNSFSSSATKPYRFVSISAVTAGIKDVRGAIDEARKRKKLNGQRTVLFVDEVHKYSV